MRFYIYFACLFFCISGLSAQEIVKWSYEVKDASNGQADLVFTGKIADGWSTYSQFLDGDDGPLPSAFSFKPGAHYQLVGKAAESGEKSTAFDQVFNMNVAKFKHLAVFTQRIKINDATQPIVGFLEYMACNDTECKPPKTFEFSIMPPSAKGTNTTSPNTTIPDPKNSGTIAPIPSPNTTVTGQNPISTGESMLPSADTSQKNGQITTINDTSAQAIDPAAFVYPAAPNDANFKGFYDAKRPEINANTFLSQCSGTIEEVKSYWLIFFLGFLGGLTAILMPCIFPLIPMTVTYFLKMSSDRASAIKNAVIYGLSIIFIYTSLGVLITMALGPTALNAMSTNMWFNLAFFAIFVIFALSLFGFFEINMPSWLTNSSDKMADKGGLLGIFFMAFTLALVSFSCTGAIVGTLLVETARATTASDMIFGIIPAKPAVGLFGFGVALGLPFALFAAFPNWLKSLPKSGGWMDNVKITLGFLELAFAFKFLSTADLVQHWGILKIELFLGLWILIALGIAAYQFGFTKIKGVKGKLTTGRMVTGGTSLALAAYMAYGLFSYQSLSLLSGLAPSVGYSFFRPNSCPHNLECYHDFDEGLKVAQAKNKPIFLDFTGYGCVNCRKMEENVWNKPEILPILQNEYVVISLYVDDDARLFKTDDKFDYLLDPRTNERMRTVGDKWSAFQVNNFNVSSQPYYVLLSSDGKTLLNKPVAVTPTDEYRDFLQCGVKMYKEIKK
jgi:cytochrome c biogenesis protein CcdA/thioredoxin-related protein